MARTVYRSGPDGSRSIPEEPQGSGEPRDVPREQQRVRVRLERAGRGGKTVTVAGPFELPARMPPRCSRSSSAPAAGEGR